MEKFLRGISAKLSHIFTGQVRSTCHELICRADDEGKAGGITGFQSGCVAQWVAHFHPRGEEFRKAWNAPYLKKNQDDRGGVVNPAIMTFASK